MASFQAGNILFASSSFEESRYRFGKRSQKNRAISSYQGLEKCLCSVSTQQVGTCTNLTLRLVTPYVALGQEGWNITRDELAMLSPYMTHHVKRFGNYVMDLDTLPQPIEDDLLLPV